MVCLFQSNVASRGNCIGLQLNLSGQGLCAAWPQPMRCAAAPSVPRQFSMPAAAPSLPRGCTTTALAPAFCGCLFQSNVGLARYLLVPLEVWLFSALIISSLHLHPIFVDPFNLFHMLQILCSWINNSIYLSTCSLAAITVKLSIYIW